MMRRSAFEVALVVAWLAVDALSASAGDARAEKILFAAAKCTPTWTQCDQLVSRIYVAQTGRAARVVVRERGPSVHAASLSRNGSRLAYLLNGPLGVPNRLVVADSDGSNRRLLVSARSRQGLGGYAWGPANRIVYTMTSYDAHGSVTGSRILLIGSEGKRGRDITPPRTNPPSSLSVPSWSPNGRWIGFYRFQGDLGTATCCLGEYDLMRIDGAGLRRLFKSDSPLRGTPRVSWSPNSVRLAAVIGESPGTQVVIDVISREMRRVSPLPARSYGTPSWSPDGNWVAFHTLLVRADGSRNRRLAEPRQCEGSGAWSADGREILFACGKRQRIGPNVEVLPNEVRAFPIRGGDGRLLARIPLGWEISEVKRR